MTEIKSYHYVAVTVSSPYRYVAVNERGVRIGQYHQNSKYPDALVDKVRELHEEAGLGYVRLAEMFGVCRDTIADWCCYRKRAQTYEKWKKVSGS